MTERPDGLFVYGTLQPGRLRWRFLMPYAVGTRPATVPGELYDSGNGWPVAVFGDGERTVPGIVVELDRARLDEALAVLDDVEATVRGSLRRVIVTTSDGASAWAYHWTTDVAGFVPIVRWDAINER